MKRKLLFILLLAATGFTACKKADVPQTPNPEGSNGSPGIAPGGCYQPPVDCNAILCTAQFAGVLLEVQDAAGAPVHVDSFVVTNTAGAPLPRAASGLSVYGYPDAGNGRYTVINDAWVQGNQNSKLPVRAKGFINGVEVFNEPLTIVADCCHVGKESGKDIITITLP